MNKKINKNFLSFSNETIKESLKKLLKMELELC